MAQVGHTSRLSAMKSDLYIRELIIYMMKDDFFDLPWRPPRCPNSNHGQGSGIYATYCSYYIKKTGNFSRLYVPTRPSEVKMKSNKSGNTLVHRIFLIHIIGSLVLYAPGPNPD